MPKKFNLTGNVGSGLLNAASAASKTAEDFKVIPLDLSLLDPNEDNEGMSLDDIDELADSILNNGLDQNFVVVPKENGRYKILTGHRRRLACLQLVEAGHTEWQYVPCLIKHIDNIHLNISDQAKEKYALITTNIQRRKNTLSDEMKMLSLANEVFDELAANGEDVGQRRKWVADKLGVSDSKVKILDYIGGHATETIKEEIDNNRVSPSLANSISHLSAEEQEEIHSERKEDFPTMNSEDVNHWKKERDLRLAKERAEKGKKVMVKSDLLDTIKSNIEDQTVQLSQGIMLSKTDFTRLQKYTDSIEATTKKISALFEKNTKAQKGDC